MIDIPGKIVAALEIVEAPIKRLIDGLPSGMESRLRYGNALAHVRQAQDEIKAAVSESAQDDKPMSWEGGDRPQRNTSPCPPHE